MKKNITQKKKFLNQTFRHDWNTEEIEDIQNQPFFSLLHNAHQVHLKYNGEMTMQLSSLLNIKTGGCPEDCKYCSQSAHYKGKTKLESKKLMEVRSVLAEAQKAKNIGADRFCIGAAWRQIPDTKEFDAVLEIIRGIKKLGLEACATLGMITRRQAQQLADAGLTAYNHNIDTSPGYYKNVTSTRTFSDRLATLDLVREAGIQVCCGGILGLGETSTDRVEFLKVLANMNPHPESVPINILVPISGTPFQNNPSVETLDIVKIIATARILMPKSRIRLSAGRKSLSQEAQILCYFAGVNSIFYGEKLLTTDNNNKNEDIKLFEKLGLSPLNQQPSD